MLLVYLCVRRVEKEALRYSFASYRKSKNAMAMSRRIMIQGILYSATLVCQTVIFIVCYLTASAILLQNILLPLQGFFNALIYMIPLFKQKMAERRKAWQNSSSSVNPVQSKIYLKRNTSGHVKEVKSECKEEEGLSSNDNAVDVFRRKSCSDEKSPGLNSKQEEQIIPLNISSESTKYEKRAIIEEVKEEDLVVSMATSSPLFLSSCVEEEEQEKASKSSFYGLYQNSELKNEVELNPEHFSPVQEEISEVCVDDVNNHEDVDDVRNDEIYIDDYLKML